MKRKAARIFLLLAALCLTGCRAQSGTSSKSLVFTQSETVSSAQNGSPASSAANGGTKTSADEAASGAAGSQKESAAAGSQGGGAKTGAAPDGRGGAETAASPEGLTLEQGVAAYNAALAQLQAEPLAAYTFADKADTGGSTVSCTGQVYYNNRADAPVYESVRTDQNGTQTESYCDGKTVFSQKQSDGVIARQGPAALQNDRFLQDVRWLFPTMQSGGVTSFSSAQQGNSLVFTLGSAAGYENAPAVVHVQGTAVGPVTVQVVLNGDGSLQSVEQTVPLSTGGRICLQKTVQTLDISAVPRPDYAQ